MQPTNLPPPLQIGYRKGNGYLALTLGILSLAGFNVLTGIPAILMGKGTLREIANGTVDPAEESPAKIGR